MSIHVWYSKATDVTGKALAEALTAKGIGVTHGTSFPRTKPDLLLCYGCKHGDSWRQAMISGWNVLNDPKKIRGNANKLAALEKMKAAEVAIALPIVETSSIARALERGNISFPVVGRTKYHQGGKGFWLCLQKDDVNNAAAEGAQYFQPYIPKGDEFRVHIFGGEHLFTAKKVRRSNPYDEWRTERKEAITEKAAEREITIDATTLDLALEYAPKKMKLPDTAIRSLHRGWVFKSVNRPSPPIVDLAKKAAQVTGLDFAAVDIMVGDTGVAYVLEANSGPGLKGQNIDKYVAAIEAKHTELTRVARPVREPAPSRDTETGRGSASTQRDTSESSLTNDVQGLLRGVNVDSLDEAGKRAVKAVIGNVLDSELGLT